MARAVRARETVQDGAALLDLMIEQAGYGSVVAAVTMHTVFLDVSTVHQGQESRQQMGIGRRATFVCLDLHADLRQLSGNGKPLLSPLVADEASEVVGLQAGT